MVLSKKRKDILPDEKARTTGAVRDVVFGRRASAEARHAMADVRPLPLGALAPKFLLLAHRLVIK